jgi:hypothetical protein
MTKTRLFTAFAAAASIAASSAPAFAKAQDSQGNGSPGASARETGERKICKRFENSSSRLLSERLCLTRTEWKKFDQD